MAVKELSCAVVSKKMLTPSVFALSFETDQALEFQAGQFISIVIPGAGPKGRDLRRAYSIASAPEQKPIELCIKLVQDGPGTNYLYHLEDGAKFRGFAPYGDFVYEPKVGRHAVFIATGTGLAPFRAMMLSEAYRTNPPASALCLLGVRTEDEIIYEKEISSIPNVKWIPTVSQPVGNWSGFKGRVTDYLRAQSDQLPWLETEYYLCGNGAMITEVKALLAEKGVQKDSIHQEKYY